MFQIQNGSLRLFRVAGIDVFLHWSWLAVAYFRIQSRSLQYSSLWWNAAEYLTVFGIVLVHEFGHALACRQVGGTANRIVLWPLGGIAFVQPPPRPGAFLWSIVAGPLVHVLLLPCTIGLCLLSLLAGWPNAAPDLHLFILAVAAINAGLLVFNLLPIYPLDGGQIVRGLLWFVVGRARSLLVVSIIGVVTGFGLVALACAAQRWWLAVIAGFAAWQSIIGWRQARALSRVLSGLRHEQFRCPSCGASPLAGDLWQCAHCRRRFDTFREGSVCPQCGVRFAATACPECSQRHPLAEWASGRAGSGSTSPPSALRASEIMVGPPSVPPGLFPDGSKPEMQQPPAAPGDGFAS